MQVCGLSTWISAAGKTFHHLGRPRWEPQINHITLSWRCLAMFGLRYSALGTDATSWQERERCMLTEGDVQIKPCCFLHLLAAVRLWREGTFFFPFPFVFPHPLPALCIGFYLPFKAIRPMKKTYFLFFPYWCGFLVLVSILFLSDKHIVESQFFLFNWEWAIFPILILHWPMFWNLWSNMEMSLSLCAWTKARGGFLAWARFVGFPQNLVLIQASCCWYSLWI